MLVLLYVDEQAGMKAEKLLRRWSSCREWWRKEKRTGTYCLWDNAVTFWRASMTAESLSYILMPGYKLILRKSQGWTWTKHPPLSLHAHGLDLSRKHNWLLRWYIKIKIFNFILILKLLQIYHLLLLIIYKAFKLLT